MACYLAARGRAFNVDAFLASSRFDVSHVWRRGQLLGVVAAGSRGRRHQHSGFDLLVSAHGRADLLRQVRDAEEFLREFRRELKRLRGYPGVADVWLDFGVERNEAALVQVDMIPADFVKAAGVVPVSLVLSHYPRGDRRPGRRTTRGQQDTGRATSAETEVGRLTVSGRRASRPTPRAGLKRSARRQVGRNRQRPRVQM
jgi:hypothetical protein